MEPVRLSRSFAEGWDVCERVHRVKRCEKYSLPARNASDPGIRSQPEPMIKGNSERTG